MDISLRKGAAISKTMSEYQDVFVFQEATRLGLRSANLPVGRTAFNPEPNSPQSHSALIRLP